MTISQIVSKIYKLTKTNVTSYPAATMLIDINNAYENCVSLVLDADGRWQWDDNNQTDLPVGTTTITSGQEDYTISTEHLRVLSVEIKDSSGTWRKLDPIDQYDISKDGAISTQQAYTGTPCEYDIQGSSIILYPTPNYTQAASLKVFFQRGPAVFTSAEVTTGTKVPGFNSLYHQLIPFMVAFEYCIVNLPQLAPGYANQVALLSKSLQESYSKRNKDDRQIMTMAPVSFE